MSVSKKIVDQQKYADISLYVIVTWGLFEMAYFSHDCSLLIVNVNLYQTIA